MRIINIYFALIFFLLISLPIYSQIEINNQTLYGNKDFTKLAKKYYQEKKYQKSAFYLKKLVKKYPENYYYKYHLAESYKHINKKHQAEILLNEIIEKSSNHNLIEKSKLLVLQIISQKIIVKNNDSIFKEKKNLNWQSDQGIYGGEVFNIKDYNGDLIIGTIIGLYYSKNNGQSWQNYDKNFYYSIYKMKIDNNNMMMSTNGGVLLYNLKNKKFKKIFNQKNINDFLINDKNIYIATKKGVYYSNDFGKKWHKLNKGLSDNSLYVKKIILVKNKKVLIGTKRGIFINQFGFTNKKWKPLNPNYVWVNDIHKGKSGKYYLATNRGFFESNDGVKWEHITGSLSNTNINKIYEYENKKIYLSLNRGLFTYDFQKKIEKETKLFRVKIYSMIKLNNEAIFATKKGIYKQKSPNKYYLSNKGIKNSKIMSILNENILGTNHGVYTKNNNSFSLKSWNNINCYDFSNNKKNILYVATNFGIFESKNNGKNWNIIKTQPYRGSSKILEINRNNDLFASNNNILSVKKNFSEKWLKIDFNNQPYIKSIISYENNKILISTDKGLYHLNNFTPMKFPIKLDNIKKLKKYNDNIYALTDKSLYKLDYSKWKLTINNLSNIVDFAIDNKGNVYFTNGYNINLHSFKNKKEYRINEPQRGKINQIEISDNNLLLGSKYNGFFRAKIEN